MPQHGCHCTPRGPTAADPARPPHPGRPAVQGEATVRYWTEATGRAQGCLQGGKNDTGGTDARASLRSSIPSPIYTGMSVLSGIWGS